MKHPARRKKKSVGRKDILHKKKMNEKRRRTHRMKPLTNGVCLSVLAAGMPGLTPASGQVLAEAAAVCLEDRKHLPGVRLARAGMMLEDLQVNWPPIDDQDRRCYADLQEATERGACGVAILIVNKSTGLVVVERSRKGTGFDYWLAKDDYDGLPFTAMSRLEVSGILFGTPAQIDTRVKQKKAQMAPTDNVAPGYVAIVEFGQPIARVEPR
jgi:hypothetical protein